MDTRGQHAMYQNMATVKKCQEKQKSTCKQDVIDCIIVIK